MATTPSVRDRQKRASDSPDVLTMRVTEVMSRYKLSHLQAKGAMRSALSRLMERSDGRVTLQKMNQRLEAKRALRCLRSAEGRYPGILSRMLLTGNLSITAKRYAITRERVRQFKETLFILCKLDGIKPEDAVRKVAAGQKS